MDRRQELIEMIIGTNPGRNPETLRRQLEKMSFNKIISKAKSMSLDPFEGAPARPDLSKTLTELRRQVSECQASLDFARDQLRLRQEPASRDQTKIDKLWQELKTARKMITEQRDKSQEIKSERESLDKTRVQLVAKQTQLNNYKKTLDQEKIALSQKWAKLNKEIEALGQDQKTLSNEQAKLVDERQARNQYQKTLSDERAKLKQEREALNQDQKTLSDERVKLNKEREALDLDKGNLKSQLDQLQKEEHRQLGTGFDIGSQCAAQLEAIKQSQDVEITKLQSQISALIEQSSNSASDYESELQKQQIEYKTLQKKLEETKDQLSDATVELKANIAKLEASNNNLRKKTNNLKKCLDNHKDQQTEQDALQAKIKSSDQEIDKQKNIISNLKDVNVKLEKDVALCEAEFEKVKKLELTAKANLQQQSTVAKECEDEKHRLTLLLADLKGKMEVTSLLAAQEESMVEIVREWIHLSEPNEKRWIQGGLRSAKESLMQKQQ